MNCIPLSILVRRSSPGQSVHKDLVKVAWRHPIVEGQLYSNETKSEIERHCGKISVDTT